MAYVEGRRIVLEASDADAVLALFRASQRGHVGEGSAAPVRRGSAHRQPPVAKRKAVAGK